MGKAEAWNGVSWVEANGFTFTQTMPQYGDNTGYAYHMPDVKQKFRKNPAANGIVTIKFENTGTNNGYLYYWGTERWEWFDHFFNKYSSWRSYYLYIAKECDE